MILPFSTQINGKPTYFVEKIWRFLYKKHSNLLAYHRYKEEAITAGVLDQWDYNEKLFPKIHTIREDKTDRWHAGMKIDFFINCRQSNMFRFAPVLPVVSTQRIFMTYAWNDIIQISINGRELWANEREQLALNDGFDTWRDFFDYFYPMIEKSEDKCFSGKIIHWTDKSY